MIATAEATALNQVEMDDIERRRHPRYPFTATVEVLEPKSRVKIQGRTADLADGGCYVDTISPFPVDTVVKLKMVSENQMCETQAKVVYSLAGMGMGLTFVAGSQGKPRLLTQWLRELSGVDENETEIVLDAAEPKPEAPANQDNEEYVLHELVIELMRQGVLSDARGKAMLRRLVA